MRVALRFPALCIPAFAACALAPMAAAQSTPGAPRAEKGYWVSTFAQGTPGKYSEPDSIAIAGNHVFIGYGDGILPDGSDGKTSNIIEYTKTGQQVHVYTVLGHNDGLKLNPYTGKLWAMQNEDANPNLVIIDPATKQQSAYKFSSAPTHGGGYDDIVFLKHKTYFSASNPAHNPNAYPAIVRLTSLAGGQVHTSPVLEGDAQATDVVTGGKITLNLQDPDSMTVDPSGDIVLDSQADSELLVVRKPASASQSVLRIPLSSPYGTPQADDTLFTPSEDGFLLVSDTPANKVFAIHKSSFAPGVPYTAAVGAPNTANVSEGFVGRLDLDFGILTPVVTGLQSPHGMAFVRTADDGTAYQ